MLKNIYPSTLRILQTFDFWIIFFLFACNFLFQSYAINKIVYPQTDEGVYLYEARLITKGFIPYKDFGMAGHTPFLSYINALFLAIFHFNMSMYHYAYITWVFLTIFPLFYTVLILTKNRIAAVISVFLFLTFPEFVQWDGHFFAIRQASIPFFALFMYFFYIKKNVFSSQLFLFLFSICLFSNFLVGLSFIFIELILKIKDIGYINNQIIKKHFTHYFIFLFSVFFYYGTILFIPHSFENFILSQVINVPYPTRVLDLIRSLKLNWPIIFFGFLGLYYIQKQLISFILLSIATFIIVVFSSRSFYVDYLSIISVPFTITSGFFFSHFWKKLTVKNVAILIILVSLVILSVSYDLYFFLIKNKTPEFFVITKILNILPGPLFTFQPIYALYAKKDLPIFYDAANMRIVRITGKNLSIATYENILKKSNTILLEPFANAWLPRKIKAEIVSQYVLKYDHDPYRVYTKKLISKL